MRIAKIIRINEEAIIIEYRRRKWKSNYNRRARNKTVWIEEVYQIMNERNLEVVNSIVEILFLTENKMIMKYVGQYIKEKDMDNTIFNQINHIKLCKKIIISVELVGVRGRERTDAYNELEKKSMLKQNINFPKVKKPIIKLVRAWNKFKEQLNRIELNTIYDFKEKSESRLKVSRDLQYYQYEDEEQRVKQYE